MKLICNMTAPEILSEVSKRVKDLEDLTDIRLSPYNLKGITTRIQEIHRLLHRISILNGDCEK